jgi:hypothetical protein
MTSEYLRSLARRCREWSSISGDPAAVGNFRHLAEELETIADQLDRVRGSDHGSRSRNVAAE